MSDEHAHEIFIVRHGHDDHEDGHHGGAWKIAFADFMTAMMALFLVLWLMSANDKNKEAIAHYFNPVKLQEMSKKQPGLSDVDETPASVTKSDAGTGTGPKPHPPAEKKTSDKPSGHESPPQDKPEDSADPAMTQSGEPLPRFSQAELFRDPFAVLDKIAAQAAVPENPAQKADASPQMLPKPRPVASASEPGHAAQGTFADPFAHVAPVKEVKEARPAEPPPAVNQTPAPVQGRPGEAETPKGAAKAEQAGLVAAIQQVAQNTGGHVEIKMTSEGALISVTEGADFPMFASASAEPQPRMVQLMTSVGAIIKNAGKPVVVRGFTDARNFRSNGYDNWRLSADRANMARLMLQRGGMPEKWVERVEGRADRQLKDPAHPDSAQNRRIEILILDQKP